MLGLIIGVGTPSAYLLLGMRYGVPRIITEMTEGEVAHERAQRSLGRTHGVTDYAETRAHAAQIWPLFLLFWLPVVVWMAGADYLVAKAKPGANELKELHQQALARIATMESELIDEPRKTSRHDWAEGHLERIQREDREHRRELMKRKMYPHA